MDLAVAIRCVMPVLKSQRFLAKLRHRSHGDLAEKPLPVMVVELLDNPVPPRLRRRNDLEIDAVGQPKPNQRPHAAEIDRTSIKGELIFAYKIVRNPHPSQSA